MQQPFTHGSLFSGIGGFDLAAEWMGWENRFHCEWNPFGQRVLKYYWPNAESFSDITKTDFTKYAHAIDVISGGFPCQPFSTAGKRLGKEDERHLWPEMLRAIREVSPRYVVGENVRGLTNWNGGVVFDEVQADLEAEGYEVLPFLLPACGVGAPHRRDRIWFIAHANRHADTRRLDYGGSRGCETKSKGQYQSQVGWHEDGQRLWTKPSHTGHQWDASDTKRIGQQGSRRPEGQVRAEAYGHWEASWINANGGWPTVSPVCHGNDGFPTRLDAAAVFAGIEHPRKPIAFGKWRQDSLKAGGNAIVPQVALQIFRAIEAYESLHSKNR